LLPAEKLLDVGFGQSAMVEVLGKCAIVGRYNWVCSILEIAKIKQLNVYKLSAFGII
jgi:hypothetical protein